MILEILIGIILGGAIGFYFKPMHSNTQLDNDNVTLKYEINSMNQKVGGLETELHLKQSELEQLKSNSEVLAKQLGEEIDRNKTVLSQKKSSEVRTGNVGEILAPFLMEGIEARDLRFLGSPIDYVCFGPDFVTFIEVKTNASKLSHNQKRIKQLVQEKKVKWMEFRIGSKK